MLDSTFVPAVVCRLTLSELLQSKPGLVRFDVRGGEH